MSATPGAQEEPFAHQKTPSVLSIGAVAENIGSNRCPNVPIPKMTDPEYGIFDDFNQFMFEQITLKMLEEYRKYQKRQIKS